MTATRHRRLTGTALLTLAPLLLAQARAHEAQVVTEIGNTEVTQLKHVLEHLIEGRSLSTSDPLK